MRRGELRKPLATAGVARLETALARGDLTVHFQPIVRLGDGALVGVEALSRWIDPAAGAISPSRFLPILEGSDLGDRVAREVWRASLDLAQHWADLGGQFRDRTVSVNFAPRQLASAAFCAEAIRALRVRGLPADMIQVEVVESTVLSDIDVVANVGRLRTAGIRIALDDFGTGFASLKSLVDLPVDTIKIDRAFVAGIHPSSAESAVIGSVVALAGTLNMTVVAEGIETDAQRVFLQSVGCHLGQGYLFSKAVPRPALDYYAFRRAGAAWTSEAA